MSNESLLAEFRARGRHDVVELHAELVRRNEAAKERICATFNAAIGELDRLAGVGGAERGRVRDALIGAQRAVTTADLTPHPSAADQLLEASPEPASDTDEEATG